MFSVNIFDSFDEILLFIINLKARQYGIVHVVEINRIEGIMFVGVRSSPLCINGWYYHHIITPGDGR